MNMIQKDINKREKEIKNILQCNLGFYRPKPLLLMILQSAGAKQVIFQPSQVEYFFKKYLKQRGMMHQAGEYAFRLSPMVKRVLGHFKGTVFRFTPNWLSKTLQRSLVPVDEQTVQQHFPANNEDLEQLFPDIPGYESNSFLESGVDVTDGSKQTVESFLQRNDFTIIDNPPRGADLRLAEKNRVTFQPRVDQFKRKSLRHMPRRERQILRKKAAKLRVSDPDLEKLRAIQQGVEPAVSADALDLGRCNICKKRDLDASFVHGRSAHQYACYTCSKVLLKRKKMCPVCDTPILAVIKVYVP